MSEVEAFVSDIMLVVVNDAGVYFEVLNRSETEVEIEGYENHDWAQAIGSVIQDVIQDKVDEVKDEFTNLLLSQFLNIGTYGWELCGERMIEDVLSHNGFHVNQNGVLINDNEGEDVDA